ncbi:DUF4350 domain-containing protein [Hymenobacter nivis]|uniref:DUF4350 domain-containing protein n=1 Tax=Hymenobacter nivis TaxID=1850093 RepID=UPI0018782CF3|nr:DUF4350 domain-containing protein [Hymenobacter nivis]
MTTFRWYVLGLLALFGAYVALEYYRPKPLDWSPTYINKDKIPYGTFVLFDQLPRLLGTDSVAVVRQSAYVQLTGAPEPDDDAAAAESSDEPATAPDSAAAQVGSLGEQASPVSYDSTEVETAPPPAAGPDVRAARANYLFVNDGFGASEADARALLRFVAQGSDVFIAADGFRGRVLRDSLGFDTDDVAGAARPGPRSLLAPDSVVLRFTHPALAGARYRLPALLARARLVVKAGRAGHTLATDAQGRAVLIRLDHGAGHFYLCSVPLAFTNYYLLRPRTAGFAAGALAYLPARAAWWDEYQKQGPLGDQSLLRVLLAHPALRAAYYLTLLGALLFVLVEARRRQRIIPILKPLPNTTLLFTRTVAGLYRQGRNHALIAEKRVALFLDYLRVRFNEASPDLGDHDFRERLSQKAGLPRARVDELLRLVNFARTAPQIDDRALLQLSRAITDFRREAG